MLLINIFFVNIQYKINKILKHIRSYIMKQRFTKILTLVFIFSLILILCSGYSYSQGKKVALLEDIPCMVRMV